MFPDDLNRDLDRMTTLRSTKARRTSRRGLVVIGCVALTLALFAFHVPLWGLALGLPALLLPVLGLRVDGRDDAEYQRLHRKWLTSGFIITSDGARHDVTEVPRPRAAAE